MVELRIAAFINVLARLVTCCRTGHACIGLVARRTLSAVASDRINVIVCVGGGNRAGECARASKETTVSSIDVQATVIIVVRKEVRIRSVVAEWHVVARHELESDVHKHRRCEHHSDPSHKTHRLA